MAAKTTKTLTLEQFKSVSGISTIEVFKAKETGKLYACDKATGEFLGMIAKDTDLTKPLMVFFMREDVDGKDTQEWLFFANGEPKEAIATL